MTGTRPCIRCRIPVDAEIYEEELGFCLECSHLYWDHKIDPVTLQ